MIIIIRSYNQIMFQTRLIILWIIIIKTPDYHPIIRKRPDFGDYGCWKSKLAPPPPYLFFSCHLLSNKVTNHNNPDPNILIIIIPQSWYNNLMPNSYYNNLVVIQTAPRFIQSQIFLSLTINFKNIFSFTTCKLYFYESIYLQ